MFGLKTRAKLAAGYLASFAFPQLTKAVLAGDIAEPRRRLKILIAKAVLRRMKSKGHDKTVQQALTRRWESQNLSATYYDTYADRFARMFAGPHAPVIEWLENFAQSEKITHVIEVGCGDGSALLAMSQKIPQIPHWTGVDINAAIIARNHQTYADNDALNFVAADATDWLDAHVGPNVLLMTYGGVMEYLAPETLSTWFKLVAERGGKGVLLTEPVDHAHDLSADPTSYLWGYESSYSHNYRALLEAEGYRVLRSAEATSEGYRTIMMLATSKLRSISPAKVHMT